MKKVLTPKAQKAPARRGGHSVPLAPAVAQRLAPAVATKVQNILNKYVPRVPVRQNINSLIDGSGNNAIAIQDLVRKLHGSGLKIV